MSNFPRIGSFEIYYNSKPIYSKLKTGQWPNPDKVCQKIKLIIQNLNQGKKWDEGI